MDDIRRKRLAEIMATNDDPAAEVALYLEFGSEVGAVVRAVARSRGGRHLDDDDLDELTYDACAELQRIGRSWRPDGGALPWTWARARIDALVRDRIGPPRRPLQFADLDGCLDDAPLPAVDDRDLVVSTLGRLAACDQRVGLANELVSGLRPRTVELLLRYQIQQDAGDPSPSHTVAVEFGLRPPAVRQVVARARRQLNARVTREPKYAPLRGSPLLGPAALAPTEVAA